MKGFIIKGALSEVVFVCFMKQHQLDVFHHRQRGEKTFLKNQKLESLV